MAAATDTRFIHGPIMRLLAAIIGVAIFAFLVTTWGDDMKRLAASFSDGESTPLVQPVGEERITDENPALAACLDERLGHVAQMKAEGVINEHQSQQFAARATSLCQAQNPG